MPAARAGAPATRTRASVWRQLVLSCGVQPVGGLDVAQHSLEMGQSREVVPAAIQFERGLVLDVCLSQLAVLDVDIRRERNSERACRELGTGEQGAPCAVESMLREIDVRLEQYQVRARPKTFHQL